MANDSVEKSGLEKHLEHTFSGNGSHWTGGSEGKLRAHSIAGLAQAPKPKDDHEAATDAAADDDDDD